MAKIHHPGGGDDRGKTATNRVGDELLFENDAVKVWSMELAPGEQCELHRHDHDYFFLFTTPNRVTAMPSDGEPFTSDLDEGMVQYVKIDEPIVHKIENSSDTVHRQVIVELKALAVRPPSSNNGRRRPA